MRARDLAEQLPTVDLDTDAMEAARSWPSTGSRA